MIRLCVAALALAGFLGAADKPSREVLELQRDVAALEASVKKLLGAFEERTTAMDARVQAATDAANKAVAASAAVQRAVEQLGKDLEQRLGPLVAALGGRVDQISGNVNTVQQAVADLTSAVNKLTTQVGDLTMEVKASRATPASPGPSASATEMFTNAERDQLSKKYEVALPEFEEYLKWYGDSPQADLAWYAIGSIGYAMKDGEKALKGFDTVLSKYPNSAKTPEALFYKAKTLDGLGRTKDAADTRAELRRRFPKNPLATQR